MTPEVINLHYYRNEFYNPSEPPARIKFGTSGHRGKLGAGFSCRHAEAIAQAVARLHAEKGIKGPVICGGDTRLMSKATAEICAEVLAGNGFEVILSDLPLPTPVFSSEIINERAAASLNGTASHNPPSDMGLKYNPPSGGPAGPEYTAVIEKYANEYLEDPRAVKKISLTSAQAEGLLKYSDLITSYVERLVNVVDLKCLRGSGIRIGIHPMGGTSIPCFELLISKYGMHNMQVVDRTLDPAFGFIPLDYDGKIRMDPSSVYPMKPLLQLVKEGKCDFAGATDPDSDRFGAATKQGGLVPPNHALAVLFDYLMNHRPDWPRDLEVGRSIGTTHLLDRIAAQYERKVNEVNVGFKYFVDGIREGRYALVGEESAGLSIYGWTPEKDGILAVMLLAEAMCRTGKPIDELYSEIINRAGEPFYRRIDAPVDENTKRKIKEFKASDFTGLEGVAGEKIINVRDSDGIKLYMENSWILARLSGTEPIVKLYAESFKGEDHLDKVIEEGTHIFGMKPG